MTQVSSRKAEDSTCSWKSSSVTSNKMAIRASAEFIGRCWGEGDNRRDLLLRAGEATTDLSWYQYWRMEYGRMRDWEWEDMSDLHL